MNAIQPVQQPLEDKLRFAIRAARYDAFLFVDGHPFWRIEEIGRRGQDEALHVVIDHGTQQVQAAKIQSKLG